MSKSSLIWFKYDWNWQNLKIIFFIAPSIEMFFWRLDQEQRSSTNKVGTYQRPMELGLSIKIVSDKDESEIVRTAILPSINKKKSINEKIQLSFWCLFRQVLWRTSDGLRYSGTGANQLGDLRYHQCFLLDQNASCRCFLQSDLS